MVDRSLRELDRKQPDAIRAFLLLESPYAYHAFLQLLVSPDLPDSAIVDRFAYAYKLMRKLVASQKRRNLEALAADPNALAAIQGAAARGADVPIDMLAVLVMDGSAASVDALVPHFDPALVAADDRLDRLKLLTKFAGTSPAIQAIFAEVTSTLDAGRRNRRRSRSDRSSASARSSRCRSMCGSDRGSSIAAGYRGSRARSMSIARTPPGSACGSAASIRCRSAVARASTSTCATTRSAPTRWASDPSRQPKYLRG